MFSGVRSDLPLLSFTSISPGGDSLTLPLGAFSSGIHVIAKDSVPEPAPPVESPLRYSGSSSGNEFPGLSMYLKRLRVLPPSQTSRPAVPAK